jgi:hypothetical protein
MTYTEIISYIDKNAKVFHAAEEEWEMEELEMDVIRMIFQYCVDQKISFEGFDLEMLLNPEDDEGLPGNRDEMMFDLIRRISGDYKEGNVEAPDEVVQLFDHLYKKFYPNFGV